MRHPFDLTNIGMPAVDGIIRALSGHDDQPAGHASTRAADALNVILSFQPRDAIEVTLSAQAVLLSAELARTARDLLRDLPGARTPRGLAGLIGMGRMLQGHLDRLAARGHEPFRSAADALPQTLVRTDPLPHRAGSLPPPETSWLDAPFEQWVVEIQAVSPVRADFPPAGEAASWRRQTADPTDAFPQCQPTGYPGTRTWPWTAEEARRSLTPPVASAPARRSVAASKRQHP